MLDFVDSRVLMTYPFCTFYISVLCVCVYVYPWKVCMFSEKKDQKPVQTSNSGDPAPKCLCCSFLKILHPEQLKGFSWHDPASHIVQARLQISSEVSHCAETEQQNLQLVCSGFYEYLNFLWVPWRCHHPRQLESV